MAVNISISLDGHMADFVAREVVKGRFRSAGEVVCAGLRMLEANENRMANLRVALAEGEASGTPEPFDFDVFIAAKKGPSHL